MALSFAVYTETTFNNVNELEPSSEHDVDMLRVIDLKQGHHEITQIKLADKENSMSSQFVNFWSKQPLPDYP
ncbi:MULTISPECIES: hypothetical protein [Shewanella]|uniref:Uncharacterized protein n=1 Tax=Shewanella psychromarinicola TaxID=2487742 RepID=A0A3N4EGW1_9GAMM|nr:hypothetical protein [Shewanella psychromarinicola]AZG34711.1 hypothetical protein EGC80_07110 [Shewanella psychromarinicola]MCL1082220.1 hypothetical protein [Shewanella psychromarinicola]RPA33500.1 hypothetical protein EGC77_09255 [Shewanella psychromarinicola]